MFREELKKQAKKILLNTNDSILDELEEQAKIINDQLLFLEKIDTEGVKPMARVNEKPIFLLRDDVEGKTLNKDIVLKNAPTKKNGYITIPREVKND